MRPGHPAGTAHLVLHPLSGTARGSAIWKGGIQAHRTRRGVIEEGQGIDLTRVCESATPGFRHPEYGHVLSETGAEDAPSNQSDMGKGRRRHPPTKLNGHTARRNCGKHSEVVWDSELPGFGLRFRPPNSKTWIVQFRERGVSRTLSLGSVSSVDAETARDKARKRLAESKLDGLPTRKKDAPPKSILFRDYVEEFLEDYARHWKPSTTYRNKHAITHQLLPVFGDVPLASITRADVMRWRDGMASRSGTFNRTLPVLAVMLGYAEQLGYRHKGSNPCRGTPRFKRALPERYLSPAEFRRLATTLREAEDEFPIAVAVIRLLIYTGARAGEIKGLRWEYIKPPRIMLPDSKTGPKTIYLNRQATAVIDALPNRAQSGLLFGGPIKRDRPFTINPAWCVIRKRAALPDVRLHDLRHSFASVAIRDGISLTVIGKLLGHALPETTARYAHLADEVVMDAASRVCSSIASALGVQA